MRSFTSGKCDFHVDSKDDSIIDKCNISIVIEDEDFGAVWYSNKMIKSLENIWLNNIRKEVNKFIEKNSSSLTKDTKDSGELIGIDISDITESTMYANYYIWITSPKESVMNEPNTRINLHIICKLNKNNYEFIEYDKNSYYTIMTSTDILLF